MSDPTALYILKAARAKIAQPQDWGQGVHSERHGTYCVAEAIGVYSRPSKAMTTAYRSLANAVGLETKDLCGWNDDETRTHAEVLAALDRAICEVGEPMTLSRVLCWFGRHDWRYTVVNIEPLDYNQPFGMHRGSIAYTGRCERCGTHNLFHGPYREGAKVGERSK